MALTQSDLSSLAETLASGKHPRVVFTNSAGQIAGKTGKVVRLEEPAQDDFVVVAFGNDELPFTAEEVRVPERGELNRKPKKKTPEPPEPQAPSGPPLLNNDDQTATQQVKEDEPVNAEATVPQQNDGGNETESAPAAKKRQPKAKSAPELTVTLAWKDNAWTVSAAKGAKVIAKPVPVKAGDAVEMVRSLQAPAVAEVVEDIVEQERHRAAAEAEQLRQQLAAAEARLAELGEG